MAPTLAYLVNQYPKVSHSFIRREIVALESLGAVIHRFSIRSCAPELVDAADLAEAEKTRVVLAQPPLTLGLALLRVALTRPRRWGQTLRLALTLGVRSERGIVRHIAYWLEACVLLGWFDQLGIQQVQVHFGTNAATVALLCRGLGGPPYSFTVHGPEEFDKAQWIHLPQKIEQANQVIAISHYGRSQLYRWCAPEQWPKLHVVHCGLDDPFFAEPLTPVPDQPRLVCVGRLCADKGQLLLLQAVAQLKAAGQPVHLTLVGDGPLRPLLTTLIDQFQLQEQVTITGWASGDKVREAILTARALILPSFAEGLPVVLMEALALGRPVLSTYVAGIPELVEPGISGWLIPAGSVRALHTALQEILTTPVAQLSTMGQAGAAKVAAQHHSVTEAQHLLRLWQPPDSCQLDNSDSVKGL